MRRKRRGREGRRRRGREGRRKRGREEEREGKEERGREGEEACREGKEEKRGGRGGEESGRRLERNGGKSIVATASVRELPTCSKLSIKACCNSPRSCRRSSKSFLPVENSTSVHVPEAAFPEI